MEPALDGRTGNGFEPSELRSVLRGLAASNRAKASLLPDTLVVSDGLVYLAAITDAGRRHLPTVADGLKPRDLTELNWGNTVLGNLKVTLAKGYHTPKYRRYAEHYSAAVANRFNRRIDLCGLDALLVLDMARSTPDPKKAVRAHAQTDGKSGDANRKLENRLPLSSRCLTDPRNISSTIDIRRHAQDTQVETRVHCKAVQLLDSQHRNVCLTGSDAQARGQQWICPVSTDRYRLA